MRWNDVAGYEGYKVSENGEIISMLGEQPKKMSIFKNGKGYPRVGLMKNGKQKQVFVHRLVATSFIGEVKEGFSVNHKNGDKKDNRLSNLEIVSQSYNQRHSNYVLNNSVKPVKCIELGTNFELAEFKSITAASILTGIEDTSIYRCCVGQRNKAGNYKWEYVKEEVNRDVQ
jgi:hypothetical protein